MCTAERSIFRVRRMNGFGEIGPSLLAISHLLIFTQTLITEFLESSGHLLTAGDTDKSDRASALSGIIPPEVNRFPFIGIHIFFCNSQDHFIRKGSSL